MTSDHQTMLRVPRKEAAKKLKTQIAKGEEFLTEEITSEDDLDTFREDQKIWSDYNLELLRASFTTDQVSKEYDYPIYTHTLMSFDDEVEEAIDHLQKRLTILRSILERLELIPEEISLAQTGASGSMRPSPRSVGIKELKKPWYKKTTIQVAIVSGLFVLLAALAQPIVSHWLSSGELKQEKSVTEQKPGITETVQSEEAWLIVPGAKVGHITAKTSEADLIRIYGKTNVQNEEISVGEGFTEPGAVIYPDDPSKTIQIIWKDQNRRQFPDSIRISSEKKSLWRTTQGISIGTTLKELEKINGKPFSLAGYGWDYGGTVLSWEKGRLENEFERNGRVILRLSPRETSSVSEKEFQSVEGEKGFSSKNKVMQQLNPFVWEIIVTFK